MNPIENPEIKMEWENLSETVFYEPRTIPAGWDLSEYLPLNYPVTGGAHFELPQDQSNP